MYNKLQFAKELKERILKKQKLQDIGSWACEVCVNYSDKRDIKFRDLLLDIGILECQPLAMNYDKLNKMADKILKEDTTIQKNDL